MNVRNCTVRTMCEKRKMTIAGELDAKKRVTEKQAQKYGCRFVYAVIEYNEMKKDGIYKPFKWDNDDITRDLCARYCICGACIDEEIPMTTEFLLLSMHKKAAKIVFERSNAVNDSIHAFRADYFTKAKADCSLCLYGFCAHFLYSLEIRFNKRHSTTDMLPLALLFHFFFSSSFRRCIHRKVPLCYFEFIAITLAAVQPLESHSMAYRLHSYALHASQNNNKNKFLAHIAAQRFAAACNWFTTPHNMSFFCGSILSHLMAITSDSIFSVSMYECCFQSQLFQSKTVNLTDLKRFHEGCAISLWC